MQSKRLHKKTLSVYMEKYRSIIDIAILEYRRSVLQLLLPLP
jgi:hypothetical protein